jgi:hypothetical protein
LAFYTTILVACKTTSFIFGAIQPKESNQCFVGVFGIIGTKINLPSSQNSSWDAFNKKDAKWVKGW